MSRETTKFWRWLKSKVFDPRPMTIEEAQRELDAIDPADVPPMSEEDIERTIAYVREHTNGFKRKCPAASPSSSPPSAPRSGRSGGCSSRG